MTCCAGARSGSMTCDGCHVGCPSSHVQVICCHQELECNLGRHLEFRDVLARPAATSEYAGWIPTMVTSSSGSISSSSMAAILIDCAYSTASKRSNAKTTGANNDSRIGPAQLVVAVLAHALQDRRGDLREPHLSQLCLCEAACNRPSCHCAYDVNPHQRPSCIALLCAEMLMVYHADVAAAV